MGAVATTGRWNMAEMQTPMTRIALLNRRAETKSGAGGRKAKNEPVIVLLNASSTLDRRSFSVCSSPPKSYSLAPRFTSNLRIDTQFPNPASRKILSLSFVMQ
jgi:hypothetical protein